MSGRRVRQERVAVGVLETEAPDVVLMRPDGRVLVEVVTMWGRAAKVEFRVRMDTVELWFREHLNAVFDREVLREWLAAPGEPLSVDEVTLSMDVMVDVRGRVALTLPEVDAWTLSPKDLASLVGRV